MMIFRFGKKHRAGLIAVAAVSVLALAACSGGGGGGGESGAPAGAVVQDSTVYVGEVFEPPSWNIYAQSGASTGNSQFGNIFDTLLRYEYVGETFEPVLATSWEHSDDLMTWTFHLREGVTFSDGTPFTAEDVLFSYERMLNHPDSQVASHFSLLAKMEAPDPMTVVLTLKEPIATFLSDIDNGMIVSKNAYETMSEDEANKAMIGTGPYTLESWVQGQQMTLVRNDKYWGDKSSVKTLVLKVIPEASARLAALKAGEIQLMRQLPSQDLPVVEGTEGIKVVTNEGVRILMLPFNPTIEPFGDVRVREAISKAIDVHTLVEGIFDGTLIEMKGPVPDFIPGADPDWKDHVYDPDAAKALVQEVGGGQPVEITLSAAAGRYPGDVQVVQVIVEQLKAVGFDVTLDSSDAAVLSAAMDDGKLGFYVISKGGYSDAGAIYSQYWLAGQSKRTMWDDAAVNEALTRQASESDEDTRAQLLMDAGNLLKEQYAAIWLGTYQNLWATADNIQWQPTADEWINGLDIAVLED